MSLSVSLATVDEVSPLRALHRQEMNCQIKLDSWLGRGWTDPYLLRLNDQAIGYGLVGGVRADPKDTIIEYYLFPDHRGAALPLFRQLIHVSGAKRIETQSNDLLLTLMLFDCAHNIASDVILFHDEFTTHLQLPGGQFRKSTPADTAELFEHKHEPVGDYVIEMNNAIVATGGYLCHYNPPYGDIYMEVAEPFRRRGWGVTWFKN
ncbi:MAG: hypothetical protein QM703_03045 [Gemmatales bacterium]